MLKCSSHSSCIISSLNTTTWGSCISGIHLNWLEKWLRYLALFGGLPTGVGGDWAGLGCQGTGPRPVGGTQLEAPPSPRGKWLQWKSVEPPDSHSTAV